MTETPSATPPPTVTLTEGFIKEKALALVAKDNSIHIIPFRSINKISTQAPGNETSIVNGILVPYKIEKILDVLDWDTKAVSND